LLGVLGSLIGFLFYNWYPSKMYMGDTGSQFLGVFLAAFSIILIWHEREPTGNVFQVRQFMLPLILFIVPLIDTITVSIRRMIRGSSPFVGGKDHTTHHLAYIGLHEREVAIVLMTISAASILIVGLLVSNTIIWTTQVTLYLSLYFVFVFTIMQVVYQRGLNKIQKKKEVKSCIPSFNHNHIKLETEILVE
jgi:UDP-GlcNAc:undecaprenyl-phosphate/decaprenyl-phosphate GlcNAc-1-phosphate transferase